VGRQDRRQVQPLTPPRRQQVRNSSATTLRPSRGDQPPSLCRVRTGSPDQYEALVTVNEVLTSTGDGLHQLAT
jgi:hypothetical protein